MSQLTYQQAGVDIETGNTIVNTIKNQVQSTFSRHVLSHIGHFASLLDLKTLSNDYEHPVLVQSIDGIGTKPIIARMMNQYNTLGIDLLSATCNDIIVLGAKPINFLDYIASDRLSPHIVEQLIAGMVKACREHDIALTGGETAEMPDVYAKHDYDVVGMINGIVEKDHIIDGHTITAGDKVYALPSNGLHTNGYSLARKALFEYAKWSIDHYSNELQSSLGEALLKPHRNYTKIIASFLKQNIAIKGMAHITGGGVIDNIPRILADDLAVVLYKDACPIPPIFHIIKHIAQLSDEDCYRTFNMGIGFVLIGNEQIAKATSGLPIYEIGEVVAGKKKVLLK